MRFVKSLLLFVSLATLQWDAATAASAADTDPKDVTITVVEDPDQLSEKVNTISLPAMDDEDSKTPARPGKDNAAEHEKAAEHGKADDANESATSGAEDTRHDAGDQAQGDTRDSKQDASDAEQQDAHPPDGAGSG